VLTSQGVPFLHAGVEMMRTKGGEHNSYNMPDGINQLRWGRKHMHKGVFDYYRGLVALRKAHPMFRMPTTAMIGKALRFIEKVPPSVVAYQLDGAPSNDSWQSAIVVFNANKTAVSITIPDGKWGVVVDEDGVMSSQEKPIAGPSLEVAPLTTMILAK